MKVYERRQMEEAAAAQLRVSPELMRGLPRPLKLALWDGGVKALLAAGWRSPGAARSSGGGGGGEERAAGIGKDAAAALRKQYAFVAATMPAVSQEDTGSELQRRYKGAVWVAGDLLHRSKPRVTHEWVELQEDGQAWADALTRAVTGCEDYAAGRARVLVFSKDVASADAVRGGGEWWGAAAAGRGAELGTARRQPCRPWGSPKTSRCRCRGPW
jgi:hypothetical protein